MRITPAHAAGLTRLALTPALALLFSDWPYREPVVLGVVIAAGITDFLDGYLARRMGTESNFGVYLDLTADKTFVNTALIIMALGAYLPGWVAIVFVLRDSVVMGIRAYAAAERLVLPGQFGGKVKTLLTFVGLGAALLHWGWSWWLLVGAAVLSLASGADYIRQVAKHIRAIRAG